MSLVSQSKPTFIEGELRCKALSDYLEERQLEKCVWLCEDATGINAKVEYHPSTNQLVGLALPLDPKTGMPVPFTYLANSAEDIKNHSKGTLATLVYVVLALPMKPGVPPFALQIFGTDNTFTAEDVVRRLVHSIRELQKYVNIMCKF